MREPALLSSSDLNFRPDTYFRPQKLETFLLSKVKGTVIREELKALFALGRHSHVQELLALHNLSDHDRQMLESCHPMFMGGNYLPDTAEGEIEIARVSIYSTTGDVTCVYAKPENGLIRYRVVDEYDGDTLQGLNEATTSEPMTMVELIDFFFRAWPLMDVLESNFEDDVDGALGFFLASSEFYLALDGLCRQCVRENFS